jgi:hypothetical protein
MIVRTRSAGDILDAHCTRCRILTNHTIVAMVEGRVARVKCNTCGSEHNYHSPKEEKAPTTRRVPDTRERASATAVTKKDVTPRYHEQWEALLTGKDPAEARAYDMAGKFRKEELVAHPIFGIGVVTMAAGNKMEVFFKDGPKLLRCGR